MQAGIWRTDNVPCRKVRYSKFESWNKQKCSHNSSLCQWLHPNISLGCNQSRFLDNKFKLNELGRQRDKHVGTLSCCDQGAAWIQMHLRMNFEHCWCACSFRNECVQIQSETSLTQGVRWEVSKFFLCLQHFLLQWTVTSFPFTFKAILVKVTRARSERCATRCRSNVASISLGTIKKVAWFFTLEGLVLQGPGTPPNFLLLRIPHDRPWTIGYAEDAAQDRLSVWYASPAMYTLWPKINCRDRLIRWYYLDMHFHFNYLKSKNSVTSSVGWNEVLNDGNSRTSTPKSSPVMCWQGSATSRQLMKRRCKESIACPRS